MSTERELLLSRERRELAHLTRRVSLVLVMYSQGLCSGPLWMSTVRMKANVSSAAACAMCRRDAQIFSITIHLHLCVSIVYTVLEVSVV